MNVKHDVLRPFYARWTDDRQLPQLLCRHLSNVANRAEHFADVTSPGERSFRVAARLAGLLHDLGKYRVEFQAYLNAGDRGRKTVETAHSVYGAAAVGQCWDSIAIAFAIAGHHSGLHDESKLAGLLSGSKFHALQRFPALVDVADSPEELAGTLAALRPSGDPACETATPLRYDADNPSDVRRFEVYTRILFSILVDSDRLDSEKFEQEHRHKRSWQRPVCLLNAAKLLTRLETTRREKATTKNDSSAELNDLRNAVFDACVDRGRNSPQGFFTLTVPTGGGKTLSSMAFGLAHAQRWGLRRVIVVIPYLSIIEQ